MYTYTQLICVAFFVLQAPEDYVIIWSNGTGLVLSSSIVYINHLIHGLAGTVWRIDRSC